MVLRILVAGHTNTGKTSLIRTLARNARFGDVSPSPATTRRIEALQLADLDAGEVTLFDSPGLERAGELVDVIETRERSRHERHAALEEVLRDAQTDRRFEQEARVLRHARSCDLVLYVIDAREPLLGKYLDEVDLLARCGKPLLPVLNFTAAPDNRAPEWTERLRAQGQQLVVELDAFRRDWDAELRFYRAARSVLPGHEALLDELIARRSEDADWQARAALRRIAETVIDLASYQVEIEAEDEAAAARAINEMQAQVRAAETACTRDVLRVYNYDLGVMQPPSEVRLDGRWESDPFAPDSIARHAVKISGPVAAGASTGLAIDVVAHGMTLGAGVVAGTLAGALAGAGYGLRSWLRKGWKEVVENKRVLGIGDGVIQVVASRNVALLEALLRRGHANELPIELKDEAAAKRFARVVARAVLHARDRPRWSRLAGEMTSAAAVQRDAAAARLTADLLSAARRSLPAG